MQSVYLIILFHRVWPIPRERKRETERWRERDRETERKRKKEGRMGGEEGGRNTTLGWELR